MGTSCVHSPFERCPGACTPGTLTELFVAYLLSVCRFVLTSPKGYVVRYFEPINSASLPRVKPFQQG